MLSKITATTLLMAAIAIGSPITPIPGLAFDPLMEFAVPVHNTAKRDSVAEGAKAKHLVHAFSNNECMFKVGENNFEMVNDGVCTPLEHKSDDDCPSLYVQPFFVGRENVKGGDGKPTSDASCELKYYYEDAKCSGASLANNEQGYDPEHADITEDGFCASRTLYKDFKDYEQSWNSTAAEWDSIPSKCPKSYTISCWGYVE